MVLVVAAIFVGILGIVGGGVEEKLKPTTLTVSGTESARANKMLRGHFGDSAPFAILLRGPAAAIDRQGPELIRALREDPKVTTLSPWDRGSLDRLRPSPRQALILADFHVDVDEAVNVIVPRVERLLEEEIHPPVRTSTAAYATISRALQEESIEASERGELIALPVLLLVLMLVFRSPIAAAIPLGFGVLTVFASRGLLHYGTAWFDVDAFALTVCTMMGLALGVDYALLMVSRFREELAEGANPLEAATATRRHAGRTVVFAGSTLLLSMIVAMFIVPGSLLASLAGTVAMVVILSVAGATLVGPALLLLIGTNIDRWRIGSAPAPTDRSRLMVVVGAALKRPAPVAALIGGIVLLLSAPALALKTSAPSPEELPKDSPARAEAELIARTIGPGWEAPFQIIATTNRGAITGSTDLAALSEFQKKLADLDGVQAVVGPAEIADRVKPVQQLGNTILSSKGNFGPVKRLARLGRGLNVAAGGVGQLRDGLSEASQGAGLLAQGSDRAGEGAKLIAAGLGRAANGSERALGALEEFSKGANRLVKAQELAVTGVLQLRFAVDGLGAPNAKVNGVTPSRRAQQGLEREAETKLPQLIAPAKVAEEQLKSAIGQLQAMTVGKEDPNYAATLDAVRRATAALTGTDPVSGAPYAPEYAGMAVELEAMQKRLLEYAAEAKRATDWLKSSVVNVERIVSNAKRLEDGLVQIKQGGQKLAAGADRLAKAASGLGDGIERLQGGATALVKGLADLTGGTEALQRGLAEGSRETVPLQAGLQRASVQVLSSNKRIRRQATRLSNNSPNLFNSGYFVLSALDGSPSKTREAAATTIDLDRGGQAATMLVVSNYAFNTPGSIDLNKELNGLTDNFAQESGLQAGVAGGAAELNDYSRVTREKMPLIIAAITFATFLVLVLILRALPLAAIAVGLNLATVAVAFGVLTALSYLPEDFPLGGREYVNAVGATMIFGIVFGLSIDYAVFLLVRMREHYDEHGDNKAAIEYGLDKTARVITGAAAIMMAVFIAFAGAPIATVSQLGVGLTVAVLLDATVVRIVLLPALMLLLGDRVWWFPDSLKRVVPKISV
jgi:putative drug exporter of the RND superfamily